MKSSFKDKKIICVFLNFLKFFQSIDYQWVKKIFLWFCVSYRKILYFCTRKPRVGLS